MTTHRPKVLVLSQLDLGILTLAGHFSSRQIHSSTNTQAIADNYRIVCNGSPSRRIPNEKMQVAVLVRK